MTRRPRGPHDLTRRDWVRVVGTGATAVALGCGDNTHAEPESLSAAIYDPDEDSIIVSVWGEHLGGSALVEVRDEGALVARETAAVGAANTGTLTIGGLTADRTYEVTVTERGGVRAGPYLARTAPRADDPRPVRFAVGADFDPDPMFASALADHLIAAAPELLVSIGDFPYTDNGPPAMTVAAYRERHIALRRTPEIRRVLEAMPLYAIYDDHEFRNNWDAAFVAAEPARYAAAMQVWDEFFPIRDPVADVRYRSWRWGQHLECFLLDCRRFRSANAAPDDATKKMIGDVQRAWLTSALAHSTATFKLVFTSVPLDFGLGDDHWATFTTERTQLFDALLGIPGILFVTADQHYFAAHRHDHGIREIQVGPFARGIGMPGRVAPGVLFRSPQFNVGVFDIDGDTLRVTGLGADGQRFYAETLTAEDLTPR